MGLRENISGERISRVLKRELQPPLRSHYVYATAVVVVLILLTAIPAYCVANWEGLGQVSVIVGTVILLSGSCVGLYPAVWGWKEAHESEVSDSLENFRTGMETLDSEQELSPDETGYDETMRLLFDEYEIDAPEEGELPVIGIQNTTGENGPIELNIGDIVTLDGEPIIDPHAPDDDTELIFPMFRDMGKRYAKSQNERVSRQREVRRMHFQILGTYISVWGGIQTLVGAILTATALF